jgi:hypothetical protein
VELARVEQSDPVDSGTPERVVFPVALVGEPPGRIACPRWPDRLVAGMLIHDASFGSEFCNPVGGRISHRFVLRDL